MLMSEYPVVSVHIPPALQASTGGHEAVMASGETVGEVLCAVGHTYPAFARQVLCGDGRLADGLCVYLGGLPLGSGLPTPVEADAVISLVATGEVVCAVPGTEAARRTATAPAAAISIGD